VKLARFILVSFIVSTAAIGSFALSAQATPIDSSCGPWDYCLCIEVGCYLGDQLCASGPGFVCYQS
jgi:hypothetical protein